MGDEGVAGAGPEARLRALGIALPEPSVPVGNYVPFRRDGDFCHLSGVPPRRDGEIVRGRVGETMTAEQAYDAARLCGLGLLANIRAALGSLDGVACFLRVFGMVAAVPDFTGHTQVIDGCSDLLVEIFGEAGRSARTSIGVGSLPRGIPVEVDAVIRVR